MKRAQNKSNKVKHKTLKVKRNFEKQNKITRAYCWRFDFSTMTNYKDEHLLYGNLTLVSSNEHFCYAYFCNIQLNLK